MSQSHQAVLTAQRKAGPGCGTDVDELPGDVCEHLPAPEQVSGCGFKLCRQVAAIPFANTARGGSLSCWLRFQAEMLPRCLQPCAAGTTQPSSSSQM